MNHRRLHEPRWLPFLLATLAALPIAACRDSNEPGPGARPTPPAARAGALAARRAARPGTDGAAERKAQVRAGTGLEAVRAAARGLVMLQETIGETAAARTLFLRDADVPAPEATVVGTALENLRAVLRMEASGAKTLGLDGVAPLLERTAQDVSRWSEACSVALRTPDDGASLAACRAELPNRLRKVDDELRAAREAGRAALEADFAALAPDERRRAACLAAAADALYAWDLAGHDLEARARAAGTAPTEPPGDAGPPAATTPAELVGAAVLARAAAASWRDLIDSGYPPGAAPAAATLPPTTDAARTTDATAREACRGVSINALPPPGEDVPGPGAAIGSRPPRR